MLRAKFVLCVAVAGDAIGISDQLTQITLKAVHAHAEEERQELERLREQEERRRQQLARIQSDPIVYVEHGSAIAIVAQYGDFPIEQQVIEKVMNSIHLV